MRPDSKDDQDKKLFIGGLNHETDENQLKSFYSQWGEITDVVVMKEPRTGKSRGFGFVTYRDAASVDAAQSKRPHEINGKKVDSKRAMPKEDTSPEVHATVDKIFVRNLKPSLTETDIRNYFSQFGAIKEANVVKNKETNSSRGFGFVTFEDTDSVDKIIIKSPHEINGFRVEVKKAVDKTELAKIKQPKPLKGAPFFGQQIPGGFPAQGAWPGSAFDAYGQNFGAPAYGAYPTAGYTAYGAFNPAMGPAGGQYQAFPGQIAQQSGDFGNYQQGYVGGPVRGPAILPSGITAQQPVGNFQQRSAPYQQQQR